MVIMVKLQKEHGFAAILTLKRIITEGRKHTVSPAVK